MKSFINQYEWKLIIFPLLSKDWKKFKRNNPRIAFDIYFKNSRSEMF